MDPRESPLFVKSVEKAFAVLRAFTREHHAMTLAEIGQKAKLDKSSAQRFVHTLHTLGYLVKEQGGRDYQLSPRLLEFGFSYMDMDPLITRSREPLKQLHEVTGEAVNLAKIDNDDIILVSRWARRTIVSVNIQVGSRLPAAYMASGRVLIASRPQEEQEAFLERVQLHRHTQHSIVDIEALREELQRVRAQGYCISRSQYFYGDLSIAAPIFDERGVAAASASVNLIELDGPDKGRETELLAQLLEATRKSSFSR